MTNERALETCIKCGGAKIKNYTCGYCVGNAARAKNHEKKRETTITSLVGKDLFNMWAH